jgi:hypothetical protein
LGIFGFRYQAKAWTEKADLRRSVSGVTAGLNDFIDVNMDEGSAITFSETFDLAAEEVRRAREVSLTVQTLGLDRAERTALRSYLASVANLVRLREQEERKVLALSGSNSALEEAFAQARNSSPYTADVYLASARRALKDLSQAEQERVAIEKDRRQHVKALGAHLPKLRTTLAGYDLVADAELAKMDPPEKPAAKTP